LKKLIIAVLLFAPVAAGAAQVCFTIPNAQVASFVDEFAEAAGCVPSGSDCVFQTAVGEGVPTPVPTFIPKQAVAEAYVKRLLVEFYARRKADKAANAAAKAASDQATGDLK